MKNIRNLLAAALLAMLAAGCGQTMRIDVDALVRDGYTAPAGKPASYVLCPGFDLSRSKHTPLDGNDLQYQEFAMQTARMLEARGFAPASDPARPDLVIALSYGVRTREMKWISASPNYEYMPGNTWVVREPGHRREIITEPGQMVPTGTTVMQRHETEHVRAVELQAYRSGTPGKTRPEDLQWQLRAVSESENGDLREAFPILLKTMLPYAGQSTGRRITLKTAVK